MREIEIQAGNVTLRATLLDTPTAQAIWDAIPISSPIKTWGEEIYFDVPVTQTSEPNARDVVEPGEIAFWPDGSAIAIGFGPTPISKGTEIRLVSPVNIWATTTEDVKKLIKVKDGDTVKISKATS